MHALTAATSSTRSDVIPFRSRSGDKASPTALERDLRGEVLAIIPHLRAFGMVLTGDRERADDLVQATLTSAWGEVHDLEVGTNLRVWLFKALRDLFYAECITRVSSPFHSADRLSIMTDTGSREAVESFKAILAMCPIEQREALLLIEWEGFSYEEAAEICRCSIDTIQSRLNAARRCCSAPN
jgi:RNA polymerase sigma-70 factor, ECF subfamily